MVVSALKRVWFTPFAACAVLVSSMVSLPSAHAGDLSLIDFQGGFLAAFQSGGNSFTGEVDWSPEYHFTPQFGVKGKFGWALMAATPSGTFNTFEYVAQVGYQFWGPLAFYVGAGAQTWVSNGGTAAIINGELNFRPTTKIFGLVDRFYASYSAFLLSGSTTHEIGVGLGINF